MALNVVASFLHPAGDHDYHHDRDRGHDHDYDYDHDHPHDGVVPQKN